MRGIFAKRVACSVSYVFHSNHSLDGEVHGQRTKRSIANDQSPSAYVFPGFGRCDRRRKLKYDFTPAHDGLRKRIGKEGGVGIIGAAYKFDPGREAAPRFPAGVLDLPVACDALTACESGSPLWPLGDELAGICGGDVTASARTPTIASATTAAASAV